MQGTTHKAKSDKVKLNSASPNQAGLFFQSSFDEHATSTYSTHMPAKAKSFFKPVSNFLQRKCDCDKEEKLQLKSDHPVGDGSAPAIVESAIHSGGQSLDANTRSFMEAGFGYDFGNVQVHNDSLAHRSSAGINALAYTHGNHVVFGEGQYRPGTESGKKLLAHELTHVVQQAQNGQRKVIQRTAAPPLVTPRGVNPGDCMLAICQRISGLPTPRNVSAATTIVDNWLRDTLACIHTNAANSNASHHAEITQNEERELQKETTDLRDYLSQVRRTHSGFNDVMEELGRVCERKQREISIEFRYNIVLDNSGLVWGYSPATDWDGIEAAFALLPAEATWMSPSVLTFKREAVNATNPNVAGETDFPTGTITVFNRGFGTAPYGRSTATSIPGTTQTIQHEIGHVMVHHIPRAEYNDFFNNILHWHVYPWAWITVANSPHPNWRAERNALIAETGMTSAQLDAWLTAFPLGTRINLNNRSYYRNDHHLEAYDKDQVPLIPAFQYAASNRDDYLSELYPFCVSNPEFVHNHLPAPQIEWLKKSVFHTPSTQNELMSLYALNEPQQTQFILRASRLFTWEQINNALQQVLARNQARVGEVV